MNTNLLQVQRRFFAPKDSEKPVTTEFITENRWKCNVCLFNFYYRWWMMNDKRMQIVHHYLWWIVYFPNHSVDCFSYIVSLSNPVGNLCDKKNPALKCRLSAIYNKSFGIPVASCQANTWQSNAHIYSKKTLFVIMCLIEINGSAIRFWMTLSILNVAMHSW